MERLAEIRLQKIGSVGRITMPSFFPPLGYSPSALARRASTVGYLDGRSTPTSSIFFKQYAALVFGVLGLVGQPPLHINLSSHSAQLGSVSWHVKGKLSFPEHIQLEFQISNFAKFCQP